MHFEHTGVQTRHGLKISHKFKLCLRRRCRDDLRFSLKLLRILRGWSHFCSSIVTESFRFPISCIFQDNTRIVKLLKQRKITVKITMLVFKTFEWSLLGIKIKKVRVE